MSQANMLSCKSCDRAIEGAALACAACGALHHEGCHRGAGHCAACASAKAAVAVSVGGRERSRSVALLATAMAMLSLVGAVMITGTARRPLPAPRPGPEVLNAGVCPRNTVVAGRYTGLISGNDPRVTADMVLRQDGYQLDGVLLWSSPNSGRNERRVKGHVDPERGIVMLHDVEMPAAAANSGWRFCPVDYYLLEIKGDTLTGSYWSQECADRARLTLRRAR